MIFCIILIGGYVCVGTIMLSTIIVSAMRDGGSRFLEYFKETYRTVPSKMFAFLAISLSWPGFAMLWLNYVRLSAKHKYLKTRKSLGEMIFKTFMGGSNEHQS